MDGQPAQVGGEAVVGGQPRGQRVEGRARDVQHAATVAADEVVVVTLPLAWGDLVDGRAADVGRGHHPQPDKEAQRAIDRRAVNGREVGLHPLIQLGHGHVPAQGAQGVEDDLALGGQARATVVEGGGEVEGGVGHGEWVAVANRLQLLRYCNGDLKAVKGKDKGAINHTGARS